MVHADAPSTDFWCTELCFRKWPSFQLCVQSHKRNFVVLLHGFHRSSARHFARRPARLLMMTPITLGIRCLRGTFQSTAHSWNRFYTDFFTYFDPELQLIFTEQSNFATTINFDFKSSVIFFTFGQLYEPDTFSGFQGTLYAYALACV